MTTTHDAGPDLARQLEQDLDAKEEEALMWRDEARWCDSLGERTRCEERAAACTAEAALIRERLGR